MSDSSVRISDTPPVPPKKRPRLESSKSEETNGTASLDLFCPENMHLVSVLRNDARSKCLVLHTRFGDDSKEAIVTLQKSPFPRDEIALRNSKVVNKLLNDKECVNDDENSQMNTSIDSKGTDDVSFPKWEAKTVMVNDIYYRLTVVSGLESANGIDMTIIYPAEPHHFAKYTPSGRHIIQETPELYRKVIVPFLAEKPKDLTWVDNILSGTAEKDRVVYTNSDSVFGFTLVLDYRWDGSRIQELHCLGIAHNQKLTCLRNLCASYVPMLKNIMRTGRELLVSKYSSFTPSKDYVTKNETPSISEDQILAYIHYPPTFYRLHVHFIHVDSAEDGGIHAGRAHLLEDVIKNLEMSSDFYSQRTMTIYLHENSPMLKAIKSFESCETESHSILDSNVQDN